MQDNKAIEKLYYKYIDGSLSAEELLAWIEAFQDPKNEKLINKLIEQNFNTRITEKNSKEAQLAFNRFKKTIGLKKTKIWKLPLSYWKSAAAVLLIGTLITVSYQYYNKAKEQHNFATEVQHDILPGSNKAILHLKNGQQIALNASGELIIGATGMQDGNGNLVTATNNELTIQTIEVPLGGQYQIRLTDGTKVWLNALSKLSFPTVFKDNKREVSLEGEAYFEVAENKTKPFFVHTDIQKVAVLGTSFNINSYDRQNHITTLISGSLAVSSHGQQVLLTPGTQSQIQGSKLLKQTVDTEVISAWKDGLFVFTKEPLESIIKKLERWYDAEFVFQPGAESLKTKTFSGSLSRDSNLSEIINLFKITESINFEINGRRVFINK